MPQPRYCTGHQQRPSQATACSPSTKGKKNSIKRGEHHKLMQCLKNINKTFTWSKHQQLWNQIKGLSIRPCVRKKASKWTGGWNTGKKFISPIFCILPRFMW
jgi:hypothetical protein